MLDRLAATYGPAAPYLVVGLVAGLAILLVVVALGWRRAPDEDDPAASAAAILEARYLASEAEAGPPEPLLVGDDDLTPIGEDGDVPAAAEEAVGRVIPDAGTIVGGPERTIAPRLKGHALPDGRSRPRSSKPRGSTSVQRR